MTPETADLIAGWEADPSDPARGRAAVKAVLAELAAGAPGRSVELRVPPFGAVQLIAGPVHRRGTPKATVEMSPDVLMHLAIGQMSWADAVASGRVLASGERADLSALLPM